MGITWNPKQREIFALLKQGMKFSQIVEQGYAKSTVSSVMKAEKEGSTPPELKAPASQTAGEVRMAVVKVPSTGITEFTFGVEKVPMDTEDLRQCFDEFRDMQVQVGWESDFSSTLREGMKLLRTVVSNFAPKREEVGINDNG
jgi:hypothetical protein